MNRTKKRRRFDLRVTLLLLVLIFGTGALVVRNRSNSKAQDQNPVEQITDEQGQPAENAKPIEEQKPDDEEEVDEWPVELTTEQAQSITVVVNKKHRLPSAYAPTLKTVAGGQLRPEAADALAELLQAAEVAGAPMKILSSFRSYSTQKTVYNNYVAQDGQAAADTYSARPGHSEHQTGLAADLGSPNGSCDLETCFADSVAGKWLAAHAHEYGFIIRYEKGKDSLTGYQYEPWHIRYLGKSVAQAVVSSGKTLDQYYNIPAGDY